MRRLLFLTALTSVASAQTYLGAPFNPGTFGPCVQYGCVSLGKTNVTEGTSNPYTDWVFQLKKRDMKLTVSVSQETGKIIGLTGLVIRAPIDLNDEALFLQLIQKSTGGAYRPEVLQRCFAKLEQAAERGTSSDEDYQEELVLARDHVGVKCFNKSYGNNTVSGIWIFFAD